MTWIYQCNIQCRVYILGDNPGCHWSVTVYYCCTIYSSAYHYYTIMHAKWWHRMESRVGMDISRHPKKGLCKQGLVKCTTETTMTFEGNPRRVLLTQWKCTCTCVYSNRSHAPNISHNIHVQTWLSGCGNNHKWQRCLGKYDSRRPCLGSTDTQIHTILLFE